MTSDLGGAAGPEVWVEVVMTLEAVQREGSFRLSRVSDRAPIPTVLFCLCHKDSDRKTWMYRLSCKQRVFLMVSVKVFRCILSVNLNMILSFCAKHFKIELKVLYCFIV